MSHNTLLHQAQARVRIQKVLFSVLFIEQRSYELKDDELVPDQSPSLTATIEGVAARGCYMPYATAIIYCEDRLLVIETEAGSLRLPCVRMGGHEKLFHATERMLKETLSIDRTHLREVKLDIFQEEIDRSENRGDYYFALAAQFTGETITATDGVSKAVWYRISDLALNLAREPRELFVAAARWFAVRSSPSKRSTRPVRALALRQGSGS